MQNFRSNHLMRTVWGLSAIIMLMSVGTISAQAAENSGAVDTEMRFVPSELGLSVEVWQDDSLVGVLYQDAKGLSIEGADFGVENNENGLAFVFGERTLNVEKALTSPRLIASSFKSLPLGDRATVLSFSQGVSDSIQLYGIPEPDIKWASSSCNTATINTVLALASATLACSAAEFNEAGCATATAVFLEAYREELQACMS